MTRDECSTDGLFSKNRYLFLFALVLLAVLVRAMPLLEHEYWGVDSGEYLYSAEYLSENGELPTEDYDGFGKTYPYFPGMMVLASGSSELLGIDTATALLLVPILLSGISVLVVFDLGLRGTGKVETGLVAALFFSVFQPHVVSTSSPMSSACADMLVLLLLWLFLFKMDTWAGFVTALVVGISLVFTHHLSLYFFMLFAFGGILAQAYFHPDHVGKELKIRRVLFLLLLWTSAAVYWVMVAEPFASHIIEPSAPVFAILPIPFIGIAVLWFLTERFSSSGNERAIEDVDMEMRSLVAYIGVTASVASFFMLGIITWTTDNWTGLLVCLFFLPLILSISFGFFGWRRSVSIPDLAPVMGCIALLSISVTTAFLTHSHIIIDQRHLQYFAMPLAVLVGLGVSKIAEMGRGQWPAAAMTVILVMNAFLVYPPSSLMSGMEMGSSQEDVAAAGWVSDHASSCTIVTDNRLSGIMFGFGGANATWVDGENGKYVFLDGDLQRTMEVLEEYEKPLLAVDHGMEQACFLVPWETIEPLPEGSIEKFNDMEMDIVYDNGDVVLYSP